MINNIYVHKIGIKNYEGVQDKNSGSYEYEMIVDEICEMAIENHSVVERLGEDVVYFSEPLSKKSKSKNTGNALIVVGGKPYGLIDEVLKYMIKDYFDVSIFIATDIDCFEMNREIIDKCDYLLHQSPICLGYKDKKHEMYNWVPEIFYNPDQEINVPDEFKNECILFAGSLEGREEKIKFFKDNFYDCVVIPKDGKKGYDCRLEYSEYKKLLPLFKNVYVTACEEALNIGWVTSRFVEAVSCNVAPIVDEEYDRFEHFGGIKESSAWKKCNVVDMNVCKNSLKYNRHAFKNLIEDILTGELFIIWYNE